MKILVDEERTDEESQNPEDAVLKLSELELCKFNVLRMRMEMILQSIRVLELEQDIATRVYRDDHRQRSAMIEQRKAEIDPANDLYLSYVARLADKYGVDPKYMGVDDETGQINDLTPSQKD